MSEPVAIEILRLVPTLIWAGAAVVVLVVFRGTLREHVVPRISRVSVLGFEMEMAVKEGLDKAAEQAPAGTDADRSQTARRAARLAGVLRGAQILLVNDVPREMAYVVEIVKSLGIRVDIATSTERALDQLDRHSYDAVVSDMARDGDQTAGLTLIADALRRGHEVPVILTVGNYQPERGVPPHAFGITNRVDELLHLVFDALERSRG